MMSIYVTWLICAAATAGVIVRPFRWPEAVWAIGGAALLLLFGLVTPIAAWGAVGKGLDVYLFLIGMMLLSEVAREHGLFDWVAAIAVNHARGSSSRLFALVYAAGVVTTAFLSNDATAVVLTPAVYAAARRANVEPLPQLLACALVANAASFILPISNPANLVLYGGHIPPLGQWFSSFALPSLAAVTVTFAALYWIERNRIAGGAVRVEPVALGSGGQVALVGVIATAILLLAVSAMDIELGLPTALAGIATATVVSVIARRSPLTPIRSMSWSVLPLVAGLFILVQALDRTGVVTLIAEWLRGLSRDPSAAAAIAGTALAFSSNAVNNLPAGLVASTAVAQAVPPRLVVDALLIGVDLGPNLSITGSLATILWLQAIRREGEDISFASFLKVGIVAMPLALFAALGARIWIG